MSSAFSIIYGGLKKHWVEVFNTSVIIILANLEAGILMVDSHVGGMLPCQLL